MEQRSAGLPGEDYPVKRAGARSAVGAATGAASWNGWLPVSAPPLHDTVSRNDETGVPAGISTAPWPGAVNVPAPTAPSPTSPVGLTACTKISN